MSEDIAVTQDADNTVFSLDHHSLRGYCRWVHLPSGGKRKVTRKTLTKNSYSKSWENRAYQDCICHGCILKKEICEMYLSSSTTPQTSVLREKHMISPPVEDTSLWEEVNTKTLICQPKIVLDLYWQKDESLLMFLFYCLLRRKCQLIIVRFSFLEEHSNRSGARR